jgi:CheY-like chemotaxis protein
MQAETTRDHSQKRLGLGLTLVRGLVEQHDGSVEARSAGPGRGAEFIVRLPLDLRDRVDEKRERVTRAAGPTRVLVIEDNADSAQSLREVLELGENTVEVACSGAEGLEKARAFGPDVVLCDIGLPGMDGYEVARAMRADPSLARTKVVALTGYAPPEDVARSREAGFDAHLVKPPSMEALEGVLGEVRQAE